VTPPLADIMIALDPPAVRVITPHRFRRAQVLHWQGGRQHPFEGRRGCGRAFLPRPPGGDRGGGQLLRAAVRRGPERTAAASRSRSAWGRRRAGAPGDGATSHGPVARPPSSTTPPPAPLPGGPRRPAPGPPAGYGRVAQPIEDVCFPVGDEDDPGGRRHGGRGPVHQVQIAVYAIWWTQGAVYEDLGATYFDQRDRQALVRREIWRLQALGYRVMVEPTSAAS
jgi:hypothetical protein